MNVLFESRSPEAAALRGWALHRTGFVFRRLGKIVQRARVQLSDVNGPRGGVDKRCHVVIRTLNAGTVTINAMAGDWRSALDTALSRASRALARSWQRGRRHQRPRQQRHDEAVAFQARAGAPS